MASFIAGGYTATYAGAALGIIEDGFELEFTGVSGDPVKGDNMGDVTQAIVLRGGGDVFLSFTMIQADSAGVSGLIWPASATFGKLDAGFVGKVAGENNGSVSNAAALVLTKVSGPNASPTTLTASSAILAPSFPVRQLLAPRLKRNPVRIQLLPFTSSGSTYFFTTI